MTFIQRNRKELIWLAVNAAAAIANLWFATWSPIGWLHLLFWAAHAVCVGLWVQAIFKNRQLDALAARVGVLLADLDAAEIAAGDEPYLADEVRRVLNDEVSQ